MAAEPLFDLSTFDPNKVLVDQDGIYEINPHRYEFQVLDAVVHVDRENHEIAGFRETRDDEFWVRGHIPGRPIFPGVLMMEASAQLVSYYYGTMDGIGTGFLGFGGVDNVKFRGSVVPGDKVVFMGKLHDIRPRRVIASTQAFVEGKLVYEGTITGLRF